VQWVTAVAAWHLDLFASHHAVQARLSVEPPAANAGASTVVTCVPKPCDASVAPVNGAVGGCSGSVASGSICQATCSPG
jgi:hypothetical protein